MFNAEFADPEILPNNDIIIVVYLMKEEKEIKHFITQLIMYSIDLFGNCFTLSSSLPDLTQKQLG